MGVLYVLLKMSPHSTTSSIDSSVKHHSRLRTVVLASLVGLVISVSAEFFITIGSTRIRVASVELLDERIYEQNHESVSIGKDGFDNPVIIVEKKFRVAYAIFRGWFIGFVVGLWNTRPQTDEDKSVEQDAAPNR